ITVAFFTGETERGNRGVLRLALLFAGGIIVTYVGVGLVLTLLLGATGVAQFAVNPWVNLVVAGFFVVFAAILMGVFGVALPARWVQALDQKSRALKGPAGVLLMGFAFTATSFTCTMPFVGTLLIAATQGAIFWPLVGMVVFATVFAIPFFLLALFPKFMVNLRGRSGNWLIQMKVALGLVELTAALKFVSNADLIWQWGIFDRELLLGAWAAIAVVTALMLLGLIPWPGVSVQGLRPGRLAAGGAFLALAVYLAVGLTGRELDSYTEAYLPPPLDGSGGPSRASGDFVATQQVHDLGWVKNLDDALAQGSASGKPIFIDFTGYTCVNCRWMEKKIFAERSVYETLRDKFVLAQLYTDGGEGAEENQRLQIERFRTLALPYYVILSPNNEVLAKHAGIMPTPGEFLRWLGQGQRLVVQAAKALPCAEASLAAGEQERKEGAAC
ncbi:MAG: thioredoxin family protein, partial [bacterium]